MPQQGRLCLNRFVPVRSPVVARRRPPRIRSAPVPSKGWLLLVISAEASYPLQLGPGTTHLPSGAEIVVEADRLHLRVGRSGATVNDVAVHGATALHPGDVLSEGELQYLVLPAPGAERRRPAPLLDHWTWLRRLEEEVVAGVGPFAVLIGRSGAFAQEFLSDALSAFSPVRGARQIVGICARNTLEILALGEPAGVDAFRQVVSERAGREEETVRWGTSWYPTHGATAEELWSVAVDRLLGLEAPEAGDLVWSDPCMTRLRAFADRWSRRSGVGLFGAEGVGRESFARHIRAAAAPSAPFIVHRGARFDRARWAEDVARAAGGSLHVRRPEILPDEERGAFWSAETFRPSVSLTALDGWPLPGDRLVIPELATRPADVGPIAEVVLHTVDVQLGRRRSSLRTETRSMLQGLVANENVRSLRNSVIRGALNATGAEVRPEHLDLPSGLPAFSGVRAKVRETERREIEAALHGSGWNVTEAARRMQLPRRTLVYRMARLGLRRPGGSA